MTLKKPVSIVLASLRGSTYRSVRLAPSLAAALLNNLFEHPVKIRGALLLRFQYVGVFLELKTEIRVLGVAHAKGHPGYWLNRLQAT